MGQEEEERFKSKKEEAFHSLDPGPVGGGEPGATGTTLPSPALRAGPSPRQMLRSQDHRDKTSETQGFEGQRRVND